MSEVKLGRVVPIYKGDYNENTEYSELDIVYYNGRSYIAKQDTKGNSLPIGTDNDYWGLIVDKGQQGPKGDKGDTGAQGKQGSMGPEGPKGDQGKDITTFSLDTLHKNIIKDAYYGAYGSPFKEYYLSSIDRINNIIKEDSLNIGFITDNHYQPGYSPHALTHYSHLATLSRLGNLDTVVLGGDNINGDVSKENLHTYTDLVSSFMFSLTSSDVFMVKGNHDKGIGQKSGLNPDNTLSDADIKSYYNTKNRLYSEVRNEDSIYGYKDYISKKIRVVFLDSYDIPELVVDDKYKYNSLNTSGYRNEQLNWLSKDALNLPSDDWSVIIFTHCPIPGTFIAKDSLQYNSNILSDILKGYNNKTNVNSVSILDNTDFNASVSVDFRSYHGKLIGLVSGHVHADGFMIKDDINFIETTASLCYSGDYPRRIIDTPTEDAWDVYSIDNNNKLVRIYRFGGYGNDRQFSY